MSKLTRILVTGARGQLGSDVCRELERRGIEYLGTTSGDMDITDQEQVRKRVQEYHPDAVIHCAAYTNVDQAEEEPEQAFAVNEQGTRNIAEACKAIDAKLIYISTDYVFPGTGTKPYEVDDPTGPLNTYGKSKLAGEQAVRAVLEKYFIVRTSWVFGSHGKNFVNTMLQLGETHSTVRVVNDQIGSPTYTVDLVPLLCEMVQTDAYGTYHATNEGECSWAEFARTIFQQADRDVIVEEIFTSEYTAAKAVRPLNSRLSKKSLVEARFPELADWKNALGRFIYDKRGLSEYFEVHQPNQGPAGRDANSVRL